MVAAYPRGLMMGNAIIGNPLFHRSKCNMKIQTIRDQLRNDLYGTLVCEHCGASQKFVGYNDHFWHRSVLPNVRCNACGCNSAADRREDRAAQDALADLEQARDDDR